MSNPPLSDSKSNKNSSPSLSEIGEKAGKLIASSTALLLSLSVIYDFSFLNALEISFNEIPSATSEHLRSALLWTPYMAFALLGAFIHEFVAQKIEGGLTEEQIQERISPRMKKFRKSGDWAIFAGVGSAIIGQVIFANDNSWIYTLGIFLWITIAAKLISKKAIEKEIGIWSAVSLIVIPLAFLLVGLIGQTHGTMLLNIKNPTWELTIKSGTTTTKYFSIGMRRFSTFAILINEDKTTTIIPNDAILFARKITPIETRTPYICYLTKCNSKTSK